MQNSGRGRPKKKVCQLDPNTGKVVGIFASVLAASEELHIQQAGIINTCNGKYQTSGGYGWRYYRDGDEIEQDGMTVKGKKMAVCRPYSRDELRMIREFEQRREMK